MPGAGRELGSGGRGGCTLDEVGAPRPGAAGGAARRERGPRRGLETRTPGRGWCPVTFAWRRLEGPGVGLKGVMGMWTGGQRRDAESSRNKGEALDRTGLKLGKPSFSPRVFA